MMMAAVVSTSGCATVEPKPEAAADGAAKAGPAGKAPPINLRDRMLLDETSSADGAEAPLPPDSSYTFISYDEEEIKSALARFGAKYKLNILPDRKVEGKITVSFRGLSFKKAMEAILDSYDYYWEEEGGLIRVREFKTKTFVIDYVWLNRGGKGTTTVQVTSGSGKSGSGGQSGDISITQESKTKFWDDLKDQIKGMLSEKAKVVINQLSGMIQVRDYSSNVKLVEDFINNLTSSALRQVEIEAKIYEVSLSDDFSLGINWNKIYIDGNLGYIRSANIVGNQFGTPTDTPLISPVGTSSKNPTIAITYARGDFDAILNAMKEQGEIRIVSQPKILTLNNQTALIKVGKEVPYFTTTITYDPNGNPNYSSTTNYTTIGTVLSITPQISADGWIMLDVSPVVTRLLEWYTSPNNTANAPSVEIKQSSALVRLKDGEMAVISGLIQEETNDTNRGVPLLGDIPGIGALFRGKYTNKAKKELVVFISPRIARN